MQESKKSLKIKINQYLEVYSQEQLQLLYDVIKTTSNTVVNKNDICKLVYNENEFQRIDSALPHEYIKIIKEVMPNFESFHYVYDYNKEPFGTLSNVSEMLSLKLLSVLNHGHFESKETEETLFDMTLPQIESLIQDAKSIAEAIRADLNQEEGINDNDTIDYEQYKRFSEKY